MKSHDAGLILGLLAGVAVGVFLVALLFKKRVLDFTFDERQQRARGQAFQYGFFTLVATVAAYGISDAALGHWIDVMTGCMLCICTAMMVFAIVCIRKDAYLSLKERPRQVMILFAVIAAVNLGLGGMSLYNGTLTENGALTYRACNPMVGLMLLAVMAVYAVNYLQSRNETEAE